MPSYEEATVAQRDERLARGCMARSCVCQNVINLGPMPEVTVLPESRLLQVSKPWSSTVLTQKLASSTD